jgi:hypothetical protein
MKAMKKGRFVVQEMHISVGRYEQLRKELFMKYGAHRPVFFPYSRRIEAIIVSAFSREGKWPTAPVRRYVSGSKMVSVFKLGGSYVVMERVGDMCVFNCQKKIDTQFRFKLIRSLMAESSGFEKALRDVRKATELATLGDLWRSCVDAYLKSNKIHRS